MKTIYSPFFVIPGSSDIADRAMAASDSLALVRDAGYKLTSFLAEHEETAALSSLVDTLLCGVEYARDLLTGKKGCNEVSMDLTEAEALGLKRIAKQWEVTPEIAAERLVSEGLKSWPKTA